MKKFRINIDDKIIKDTRDSILKFNWGNLPNINNWDLGVNKFILKDLCDYWISNYDWKLAESELNNFNHYTEVVDDLKIHFVYEKGMSQNSIPLLVSHGWPGSFLEFKKILEPLTNPKKYGLDEDVCFDLVMPSIPGFAFSDAPKRPLGPRKIANYYNKLMIKVLNYKSYMAQGGDWGGAISSWLGYDHKDFCKAIHLNIMIMRERNGPQSEEEREWQNKFKKEQVMEEGYRSLQATKPQTLAFAMNENPVGIAAWILEKFHNWSDLKNKTVLDIYSKEDLITNIMIYIVTNTFNTASWIYYGRREEGGRVMNIKDKITTPTACALFPAEFLSWPPKSYVDRMYNVLQWTEHPSGGHFAAMEEPTFLLNDIRSFAYKVKSMLI
tara:strand:- start:81 stop:1229 length:1149 start_codon:yes stop_codon:yes gene_type:complete